MKDLLRLIKNPVKKEAITNEAYVPIECLPMRNLGLKSYLPGNQAESSLIEFSKDDILIGAMRVYFHRVTIAPFDGITRSTCFVLRAKKKEYLEYCLALCNLDSTIDYAETTSKGTTMPYAIWDNGLGDMDVYLPPEDMLMDFSNQMYPIVCSIRDSYKKIEQLTLLRDYLLPKLMSGEIDVSTLEIPTK